MLRPRESEDAYPTMRAAVPALLLSMVPTLAHAQAGPPLITNDPDTPGPGAWEINIAATGDRTGDAWAVTCSCRYTPRGRIDATMGLAGAQARDQLNSVCAGDSWIKHRPVCPSRCNRC